MKQYECLTKNSSLASAIYVPFYPGLQVSPYLWNGSSPSVRDSGALDFVSWVKKQPEWKRVMGKDHFFIVGRINWDFNRFDSVHGWGSKLLTLPESKNMTVLSIETNYPNENEFAVPYPTYFHPSNVLELHQWQEKVQNVRNRTFLFVFAGAPRPGNGGSIRTQLINECKKASNSCTLVHCSQNDDLCSTPTHIIDVFMDSHFCLQPAGDSYTRRSTFDSILAGCIPVFFHPQSAYKQYIWHLPENYTRYSVFIPEDGIRNGSISVEKVLSEISKEKVLGMREELIKLIPKIVYANNKLEGVEDAFDISIKEVLKRIQSYNAPFG
ncbi:unnamed protein product [Amaranthus hypochondriacus]